MADDVLINKAATIERCVRRAREEYDRDPTSFATDFTRQDAAILNIQRACEAALDMGQHLSRCEKLGVPQSARCLCLAGAGRLDRTGPGRRIETNGRISQYCGARRSGTATGDHRAHHPIPSG